MNIQPWLGADPDLNSCIDVMTSYHHDSSIWTVTFYFGLAIWIDCPAVGFSRKCRILTVCDPASGCAFSSAIFRVSLRVTCCAIDYLVAFLWNVSAISIYESATAKTTFCRWTSI